MSLAEGLYTIRPTDAHIETLLIGPVPVEAPDTAVKISSHPLIERWLLKQAPEGKYFFYYKRDRPVDYKFVAKKDDLYVSSSSQSPTPFRVQPAEGDTYVIIHSDNEALTANPSAKPGEPQLILQGQDGSSVQRFVITPARNTHEP